MAEQHTPMLQPDWYDKFGLKIKSEFQFDRKHQSSIWGWVPDFCVKGHAESVDVLEKNPATGGVCSDWIEQVAAAVKKQWFIVVGDAGEVRMHALSI